MTQASAREYSASAASTDVFGRTLCNARQQHFVVDGPVQNGCPGEAVTPAELFLAGVASCGVELVQVLARESNLPLTGVRVGISGVVDRSQPVRPDLTLFHEVRLRFHIRGVTNDEAGQLVKAFQGR